MAAGTSRKISAASARAHTRKPKAKTTVSSKFSVFFRSIFLVAFVVLVGIVYKQIQPPPPKTCGSADGPLVTAPRIQLRDGRYLAYREYGVPKDTAKHKVIFVHGFDGCRHSGSPLFASLSPDIVESKGIYFVSFDRPGYGESDPHPSRTAQSLAYDIEELGDQLGLGSKFYVVGFSMGGQAVWGALKYIPHRLKGAVLLAPVVNYWWPSFPANLSTQAYKLQPLQDQWALRIGHYLPWLTYWWNTQKFFPSSSVIVRNPLVFSKPDLELLQRMASSVAKDPNNLIAPRQQGEYESLHRDIIVGFGNWEFDPTEIQNPFPDGEGSVHLWQGETDLLSPALLQRHIASKLPWIQYHELPGYGHLFIFDYGKADSVFEALLR